MGGGGGECPFTRAKNFLSPRMQQTAEAKANAKPAAYNTNWWPNQLRPPTCCAAAQFARF